MIRTELESSRAQRYFDLVELFLREGDARVVEAIEVEVCEQLVCNPEWWPDRVQPFIGPELILACQKTRMHVEEVLRRSRRSEESP